MEFNGIDYTNESDFLDAIEEHEARAEFGKKFAAACALHEKTLARQEKEKLPEGRRDSIPTRAEAKITKRKYSFICPECAARHDYELAEGGEHEVVFRCPGSWCGRRLRLYDFDAGAYV
jgi:predicted RNA-binding Zn-ribbon protein involved in translation (DUF1610 family)